MNLTNPIFSSILDAICPAPTPVGAGLTQASAAVAELIEAVEAHNKANDECAVSCWPDADRAWLKRVAARERLDAALARVGGGK